MIWRILNYAIEKYFRKQTGKNNIQHTRHEHTKSWYVYVS